jgi:hypothetical protein
MRQNSSAIPTRASLSKSLKSITGLVGLGFALWFAVRVNADCRGRGEQLLAMVSEHWDGRKRAHRKIGRWITAT